MKKYFMRFINQLTNVGASLQTPIAILPAAGILLALGTVFTNPQFLEMMPFAQNPAFINFFSVLNDTGGVIFGNLPIIFAIGVAIGLTNNDGVAALSAIVGYFVMNVMIGGILGVTPEMIADSNMYATILGIPTLQTGVLGGIIVGWITAIIYNKFHDLELPQALEFFAGKRSVPIITAFIAIFIAIAMTVVWPPVQIAINNLSDFIVGLNPGISGFMFGFVERLTIPFGMNHVWWPTFWHQAGEYVNSAGDLVRGDQLIFFSQLSEGVDITAGTFMNGLFVLKIFSMPAIALAMYHAADEDKKSAVYGILLSGAITSLVSGITEPIEFLFIFTAPVLWLVYAVITGLGFTIMNLVGANLGLSFSGGLLDYLFFNLISTRTGWWLLIPVGIAFFAINYVLFRYSIEKFDLKTPGRSKDSLDAQDPVINQNLSTDQGLADGIIAALGGKNNINHVNSCYSRLRVEVKDPKVVNSEVFSTQLGASGSSILGQNVQVIYGNKVTGIRNSVMNRLNNSEVLESSTQTVQDRESIDPLKLNHMISPADGELLSITEVSDEVFSSKAMGDGFALRLTDSIIKSPVDGRVASIFPTKHAILLVDNYENEILLHIGLDTVELEGMGIRLDVEEGDRVNQGQLIAEVDVNAISDKGYSLITPIVFTNLDKEKYKVNVSDKKHVVVGDSDLFKIS